MSVARGIQTGTARRPVTALGTVGPASAWALHRALHDLDWRDLPAEERARLRSHVERHGDGDGL